MIPILFTSSSNFISRSSGLSMRHDLVPQFSANSINLLEFELLFEPITITRSDSRALESDLVIVIGSKSSSNSNRLMELAENCGTRSCLIDNPEDLDIKLLDDVNRIGITAGASAPEYIVQDLIKFLKNLNFSSVRNIAGSEEDITFKLPRELID